MISILRYFEKNPTARVTTLSEVIGVHKSTISRICKVLESEGFLSQDGTNGYRLGLKLVELGNLALGRLEMRELSRPFLQSLMNTINETIHLVQPDGYEVVFIDKLQPETKYIQLYSRIGRRLPINMGSVGKAILAFMGRAAQEESIELHPLQRLTPNSITDTDQFFAEMDLTRARGWAWDREEVDMGCFCVGAPVFGPDGTPVASISTSALAYRLASDEQLREVVAGVQSAAQAITRIIGGRPPGAIL